MLFKIIKVAIPFCVYLLYTITSNAQTEVTDFGVFTREEINLKECAFDKEADAVVLLDKANSNYNDYHNLITERRIRFKILKERGIERGNIHIMYYSGDDFEAISGIDAVVLSFDGQNNEVWSKLDRKLIYTKKLNKYFSEISFALPNIKPGTIIEYKYQSQMKHYGGLREWVFQRDMPVVLSSYYLIILPNAEFAYSVYKSKDMSVNIKQEKQNGGVLFEMTDVPGLREEAYMGAAHDYLQRVKFQFSAFKQVESGGYGTGTATTTKYTSTWNQLAKELLDDQDFGSQITKNLPDADLVKLTAAVETDPFKKMKLLHDYVRSHFSWDHIYTKYAIEGLNEVWKKKTGSSGGINLILINLLKSAGLTVSPLLVSERSNGKVDTTYPFVDQFDKVVAYVTIGGKSYILDGTDQKTPSFIIPFALLNTTGFIVDKKNPALIKIMDDARENANIVNITGTIDSNGIMHLEGVEDNYDYAKIERKERYQRNSKLYEKDFFEPYNISTQDTFKVEDAESDSLPLHHTIKLDNYALNKTSDYFLLNYNLFTGLNKNPFITEQRFSDIDFGSRYSYAVSGSFDLPQNLTPEALPKNIKLVLPDKSMSFTRQVQQTENNLQIAARIRFTKTEYSADDYQMVQAFYRQMLELLNEPIVLKAK